jgi:hypothetical protein
VGFACYSEPADVEEVGADALGAVVVSGGVERLAGFPELDREFLVDLVVEVGLPVLAGGAAVVVEDACGDADKVGLVVAWFAGWYEECALHWWGC